MKRNVDVSININNNNYKSQLIFKALEYLVCKKWGIGKTGKVILGGIVGGIACAVVTANATPNKPYSKKGSNDNE